MTDDQKSACHKIIHGASGAAAAVGAGFAQLPMSDNAVLVPIQITMVCALGKVFKIELTESIAKGVVLSIAAGYGGRLISQILVGWIPGLGNAVNATTAAGLTEAVGWAVVDKLDKGLLSKDSGKT